ncbi:bacterioferritin [Neisseriaceae bacterium PsAf]|nr:bacterioferritin [Neisseriaceae bacterium PsAf]MCV2502588.1 bacterioferritin [Neisseriaceae bacterium]
MKISKEILTVLNANIGVDLVAINQYFLHARMLKHWGYESLGSKVYHRSIEVMKLSDDLIQRIFLLEGLPNLQKLGKLFIGQSVEEILQCDLKLEEEMRSVLQEAILLCEKEKDFVSRKILVRHLDENEEYIDDLTTEINLLKEIGLQNYLQKMI